uniref:Uncharacterized protein n=1 Tax=Vannella robusta TaxID=1487602 RepID=A0A7S4MJ68_9EUKA
MAQPTTAMKTHRFGKVVEAPEISGIAEVEEVPVPDEVAEAMEKAIRDGDSQALSAAIAKVPPGARVSQSPTRKAESLLHLAAELGYFKCARVVFSEGKVPIDIALRDKTQPLHHAAANAHEAAIVFFVENGADIECKNVHGETPLHLCAKARDLARKDLYVNCINRLVELKGNIEAQDNSQYTPLHKAAQAGDINIAKCLLNNKADPAAKDMFGHNALEMAEERGHVALVNYFKKNGKKVKGKDGEKCVIS